MRRQAVAGVMVAALSPAWTACDGNLADAAGPTPGLQPALSGIQREIFNATGSSGRPACVGVRMPAVGPLMPGRIAVIRRWIELGRGITRSRT